MFSRINLAGLLDQSVNYSRRKVL